jgi:hypothetical protein
LQAAMVASSGGPLARDLPTTCTIGSGMSMETAPLDKIVESRVPRRKQARWSRARPHLPLRKAGLLRVRSRPNCTRRPIDHGAGRAVARARARSRRQRRQRRRRAHPFAQAAKIRDLGA